MDSGSFVLNISSDEEDCEETRGERSETVGDDFEEFYWEMGDFETEDFEGIHKVFDDPNDVILVSDANEIDNDDDDDCMILDGDPDEPISIKNDSAIDDSDDLVIVGAKGQIACRDFPHPRHLCANYEFDTTQHEKYCSQCHCYVCDALAPCVHWGNGISKFDHCHATEKSHYWKHERKQSKQGDEALPQPPKVTDFYSNGGEHLSLNIRSRSTTVAANRVARCSSRPNHPPGFPNSHVSRCSPPPGFPNSRLRHIIGMRTTFKRSGGDVLANNGFGFKRLPSLSESRSFQSTAFSLPEPSQSFDHTLPINLVSSEPHILLNPLPSQSPKTSSEQENGENSILNSQSFTQPESPNHLFVNSTYDIPPDDNQHISNGWDALHFGSDISHNQNHDFSSPIYDPCFPNGNGSSSLGEFDTDPWLFDPSPCSLSPVLDVVYPPEPPPTMDTELFSPYNFLEMPP
ncbi:uncharacterized protein LOC124937416 [Impatiens glandulifera]|uniref:uncharacterized protein LOC124937416 n=1 Tax=Impatiens glandulifera TaxID=253017 RepID=UPI001FB0A4FC|nr:uncharacterized protein LOC124937416 [Impatiens glandulifera]